MKFDVKENTKYISTNIPTKLNLSQRKQNQKYSEINTQSMENDASNI